MLAKILEVDEEHREWVLAYGLDESGSPLYELTIHEKASAEAANAVLTRVHGCPLLDSWTQKAHMVRASGNELVYVFREVSE